MKKFLITEEEKNRILSMHKEASRKHYLGEQVTTGNTTSTGTTDSEETEVEPEGVKIGIWFYKKPGITENNLANYIYGGKPVQGMGPSLVIATLNEFAEMGLATSKGATSQAYNARQELWKIIKEFENQIGTTNPPLLSGNAEKIGYGLSDLSLNVMQYVAQEGIDAKDFSLKNYESWVSSPSNGGPYGIEPVNVGYLVKVFPNLEFFLKKMIEKNNRFLV